jgi:hypothetical protein
MENSKQILVAADPETILDLVSSATYRLVVLAPAVSMGVAEAIRERWHALGPDRVSVTLDVDPEVYRLGYGDPDALPLLESTGRDLGGMLNSQPGVRIGVVIADATILVYSPVPQLIEAGPRDKSQPTGLLMTSPAPAVEDALGVGERGILSQEVGLDKASLSDIEDVQADLARNPPQKFDVARTVRVFNAAIQFVELKVQGTDLKSSKISIPNHLLGVADKRLLRELKTTLQVVPEGHDLSGEDLKAKRARVEDRYLRVIPGFGYAVRRTQKEDFRREYEDLKAEVEAFRTRVKEELDTELDERVQHLVKALLPGLKGAPPSGWPIPNDARREEEVRRCLEEDLRRAIPDGDAYARQITTRLIFRDVTYESLNDAQFREAASKAFPELSKTFHSEYDAAAASGAETQPA